MPCMCVWQCNGALSKFEVSFTTRNATTAEAIRSAIKQWTESADPVLGNVMIAANDQAVRSRRVVMLSVHLRGSSACDATCGYLRSTVINPPPRDS